MCVEDLSKEVKVRVMARKLFATLPDNRLGSLCYMGKYSVGQIYVSTQGPGFQAFVRETDAIGAIPAWDYASIHPQVCAVMLYNARRGIVHDIDAQSNGKSAWCAERMKVLASRNV